MAQPQSRRRQVLVVRAGPPRSSAAVLANRSFPSPMLEEPQDFREDSAAWLSRPAGEPVRAIRM